MGNENKLAVISSISPVGVWRKDLAKQHFAMHLSVGIFKALPSEKYPKEEKMPWDWGITRESLVVLAHDQSKDVYDVFSVEAFLEPAHYATPKFDDKRLGDVKTVWINRADGDASFDPTNEPTPARIDGASVASLPEQLIYLSTFPGNLPQLLSLVTYFRLLPFNADGSGKNGQIKKLSDITSFIIAPKVKTQRPPEDFRFNDLDGGSRKWMLGWAYVDGTGSEVNRAAFVRPLGVKQVPGQTIIYTDDGSAPTKRFDFSRLWFQPGSVVPWTEKLDQQATEVFNAFDRFCDAVSSEAIDSNNDWIDLRLKALAFNAQWDAPTPQASPSGNNNKTDTLVKDLLKLLGAGESMEAHVRGKLALVHQDLSDKTKPPEDMRTLWCTLVAATVGGSNDPRSIFEKVRESRAFLDLMLFAQWIPVFVDLGLHTGDAQGERYFLKELGAAWAALAQKQPVYDLFARVVREQRHARALDLLSKFPLTDSFSSPQKAAGRLAAELTNLCSLLRSNRLPAIDTRNLCADPIYAAYVESYRARLELLFIEKDSAGNPEKKARQDGLTIDLDDLSHLNQTSVKPISDNDIWRKLAGAGVMIREKDERWRIATAANVCPRGHEESFFDNPAIVPLRMPYRNGVRYPVITYNRRSLSAADPLSEAVSGISGYQISDDAKMPASNKYEYRAVLGNPADDKKTLDGLRRQQLIFGNDYEIAAFMIDPTGGLPDELVKKIGDESIPWQFDYDKWTKSALDPIPVPEAPFKTGPLPYRREVSAGQARAALKLKDEIENTNWPEIPPNVFPLAKEIERSNVDVLPDTSSDPRAQDLHSTPLLIVHEQLSSIGATLTIRPPTVDRELLECWPGVASDASSFEHLLIDYHTRLLQVGPESNKRANYDISLDDPAVTELLIVLEQYDFDLGAWKPKSWEKLTPLVPDDRTQEIDKHQKEFKIHFVKPDAASFSLEKTNAGLKLRTPDTTAAVARVSVYVLVAKAATGLFFTNFFSGEDLASELSKLTFETGPAITTVTDNNVCLKPYQFLVERPSDAMPTAEQLWQALFVSRSALDEVSARLNLAPVAIEPSVRARFRNVTRIDLLKQPWRWQGREIDNDQAWLEGANIVDTDEKLLSWEAGAFAEMDDTFDTLSIPRAYPLKHPPTPGNDDSERHLYTDTFDKDARSYYLRYGARAYSRYFGLYDQSVTTVTSKQRQNGDTGLSGIGWKRAFIPYRGPRPPKPVIKAVVPLTQASADNRGPAPLMIVIDETMFSFCGITEYIECEVERVAVPKNTTVSCDGQAKKFLFQAGHDPTLFGNETPDKPGDYVCEIKSERLVLPCGDAVGYTFDTDARQPLFGTSSLVVRPHSKDDDFNLRSWDFAKIRFRRLSRVVPGPSLSIGSGEETEWTKPLWVQFLPPSSFSIDLIKDISVDSAGNATIKLPKKEGFNGPSFDTERFAYRVLVTSTVTDFQGNREHEEYHDIVDATPNSAANVLNFKSILAGNPAEEYRYRLLEIQRSAGTTIGTGDFWVKLLGTSGANGPEDAPYRITRISPFFVVKAVNAVTAGKPL